MVIVTVCASGHRSAAAARTLQRAGYHAENLKGGIRAWTRADYQPINRHNPTTGITAISLGGTGSRHPEPPPEHCCRRTLAVPASVELDPEESELHAKHRQEREAAAK
jgi:hypothetical protein